ncbi:flagellin lysine-N-methylase [Citrobacter freundii]|uniref:flagellin lysine-N-methylase n=1 Tax=Citrobacter freundii TaxID=546 RepID=UPI000D033B91|nr:flagellin lysine-N-methylase [Citrobacter freundii]MBJ8785495.1 flagellin lysine-N-methylase [Citrobacter freundii]MDV0655504.1 flagellin lysine-N-methylase [Citrobacter freundii]MDV0721041.1 flagellin lysine-N-methylase [Citrobacter freundii]MEB0615822.1 flagellin lysine-N-methylase [Citrobacter freundii]MEB0691204.1 flagellin lysine-N-methylase [Citrobacter freundii]
MKEIIITEPAFVAAFNCVGSECRDHCCKEWEIAVDKPTVKKYLTNKDLLIQTIAKESVQLVKKDSLNWGEIIFSPESGNCPYFGDDKLCMVHKRLGAQALSKTCAIYPRSYRSYKNDVHQSLNISCPEVVRLLLSEPDAMKFNERILLQQKSNAAKPLSVVHKVLSLFCLDLIERTDTEVEPALFAVVKFLLFLEKIETVDESTIGQIESVHAQLVQQLQNGEVMGDITGDYRIKCSMTVLMQNYFRMKSLSRGGKVLTQHIDSLLRVLAVDNTLTLEEKIADIERMWRNIVLPKLGKTPFALKNYILYKFWQNDFPDMTSGSSLRGLYMIVAEYYFIKLLMSAHAKETGTANLDDLINVIYSFHSSSQHNKSVTEDFYRYIENVRMGDDLSLVSLLV